MPAGWIKRFSSWRGSINQFSPCPLAWLCTLGACRHGSATRSLNVARPRLFAPTAHPPTPSRGRRHAKSTVSRRAPAQLCTLGGVALPTTFFIGDRATEVPAIHPRLIEAARAMIASGEHVARACDPTRASLCSALPQSVPPGSGGWRARRLASRTIAELQTRK
jgi:hypothetical protein